MLNAGCNGIFVGGSTGRGPWFSRDKKAIICKAAADQVDGRADVMAGCMAMGLMEMLENASVMSDSGATAAVITSPCYFNYNQQELESIFLAFADNSPLPVMLYDIPVFANSQLDENTIRRLAEHENVIGFKDSSANFERFEQLLSAFDGIDDFYLMQGKEHLLAESILNGASGLTVSLLHMGPELFVALHNSAATGDVALANRYQQKATQIMELILDCFKKRPETSTLFHFLNYALNKRGICDNILLEHEGACPDWLAQEAEKAMGLCNLSSSIQEKQLKSTTSTSQRSKSKAASPS